jgi:hypothetical protein
MCSLRWRPGAALARTEASVAFRTSRRVAAQVVAVQLDQVERIEEDAGIVAPVTDALEARPAVIV